MAQTLKRGPYSAREGSGLVSHSDPFLPRSTVSFATFKNLKTDSFQTISSLIKSKRNPTID